MAYQDLKINLLFEANTQAALSNVQQLNNLLKTISSTTTIGVDGGPLSQAVQSAQQLQAALSSAVNVDTGKLNLNTFNTSLKTAGTDLKTVISNLSVVGTQGTQSFVKLANAVAAADAPMLSLSTKLKSFGTTLLNTVKWQLASKAINGVTNSISGAITHAKNLNNALNDIQIVTGFSSRTMANLANEASAAAKALNTTTQKYAEAALIFYQQGLRGSAIDERAETVLKLAQVTGESAQEVSNQMTAIWNNFYDGSKSIEYYADVITALGAATASSSSEIAAGLEKFAAVAETVGLSYEYAAASLATVVAETRQAPEVVGTAFKTLFARLQGLSLGETLEDGTDLNKYSKSLQAVGVEIKDQYGELKDAETILQETAEKWEGLGRSQQVALAQSVGGLRQYTQFIALMENWEAVELNVDIAEASTGELTQQQEIWSTSWEAASERAQKSKDDLYEKFINDKTVIKLSDFFSELRDVIGTVIEKMGGILPIVGLLTAIFAKSLFPIITNVFTRLSNNIAVFTGKAEKDIIKMQNTVKQEITNGIASGKYTETEGKQLLLSQKLIDMRQEVARTTKNLSLVEQEAAKRKLAMVEATISQVQASLELQAQLENEIKVKEQAIMKTTRNSAGEDLKTQNAAYLLSQSKSDLGRFSDEEKSTMANTAARTTVSQTQRKIETNKTNTETEQAKLSEAETNLKQYEQLKGKVTQIDGKSVKIDDKFLEGLRKKVDTQKEIVDGLDKEKLELETILDIQKKQNEEKEKSKSQGSLVVGKTQDKTGFFTQKEGFFKSTDENDVQGQISQNLKVQAAQNLGGDPNAAGGFQVEGSLDNLQKAYMMQEEYSVTMQKSKALTTELAETYKQYTSAVTKASSKEKTSTKERKAAEAQQKKSLATLKASQKEIRAMAEQAGVGDKKLKELDKAFDALAKGGKEADKGMEFIQNTMKELDVAFDNASQAMTPIIEAIKKLLLAAGVNPEVLDNIANDMTRLAGIAPQTKAGFDQVGNSAGQAGIKVISLGTALSSGLSSLGKFAGTLMSLKMGFDSLKTAFDGNASAGDRFQAVLMAAMTILPIAATGVKALSAAYKEQGMSVQFAAFWQTLKSVKDKISITWTAALAAQEGKSTVVKYANAAATVAQAVAQTLLSAVQQLGWVGVAVGIAAVAALTIALVSANKTTEEYTKSSLEATQQTGEAAKKTLELADAWKEQMDTMDGLIDKWKDLKEAQESTVDVTKEIVDATTELIESYNKLASGLGIADNTKITVGGATLTFRDIINKLEDAQMSNNVEDIQFYSDALDIYFSGQAAEAADTSVKTSATAFGLKSDLDEWQKDDDSRADAYLSGNTLAVTFGSDDRGVGGMDDEELASSAGLILQEVMGNYYHADSKKLNVNASDPDALIDFYEKLKQARNKMAANIDPGTLAKDPIYMGVEEYLTGLEEEYNNLIASRDANLEYGMLDIEISTGLDQDDVVDYSGFQDYRTQLRDAWIKDKYGNNATYEKLTDDQKGTVDNDIDTYLKKNTHFDSYFQAEARIRNVSGTDTKKYNNLMASYEKMNEEEPELAKYYGEIDLNKYQTYEEQLTQAAKFQGIDNAKKINIDETQYENYLSLLKQQNEYSEELYGNLTNYEKAMNAAAKSNMRANRGAKTLADNWEDWNDAVKSGDLSKYSEDMDEINGAVQDLLDFSDEDFSLLPENFVQRHWSTIEAVLNGTEGALDQLRDEAGKDILLNIEGTVDANGNLNQELTALHNQIASFDSEEFTVGVKINDEEFIANCNGIIQAANMTAEQAEAYFAGMGYDVELEEVTKTNKTSHKVSYFDPKDQKIKTVKWTDVEITNATAIKTITPNGTYGGGIGVQSTVAPSSQTDASGSSSEPEEVKRTKKSDIVERFKETEDALDDIADSMERVNKQMDRMYGASRLKAMDKELELLEDEAKVLEQQKKENEKYLKEDQKALEKAAKEAGVRFNIDANGNITNYTEEMTRLYDQLAQAEEKMSKMSTKEEQDAYQENVIDPLMDRINNVSDAAEAWSESVEKDEELLQKIEENLYQRQDKEFEKLQYEVEFKIELNEEDLAIIDYYFEKYADDIYTAAEQAATFGDKIQNTLEKGKIYEDQLVALNEKYEQGLISDADYAESLGEIQGNLIEVNQELLQYQEDMENFYGETLQLAMEEIEKYTGKFENMIGVLDHYRTIMDLMGKSSDYKMIDKVLENKQTILNNKLSTSKETYNTLLDQEQALLNQLNNSNLTETQRKNIEAALEETRTQLNETYDLMLSDAEAAMENLAEILANNIEKANKQLEGILTGGRSFDALSITAERLQGSQEEYLTTTNKIYETTKMIRNIQNEIDKTTNTVAKQRLKSFQEQTQMLQNQSKLSQFELDIQQKKYDLLLAEIALEEAQNAKSVVRLQRDSEGNFGYVYTANQEDVSSAQQGVDDANNALYNARLEGANNYALQYQEIMSQLYNDLAELQEARTNGEITSEEEYERRKLEIIEYYSDKLTTVSDLYSFAIAEDAKIAEEAWSSSLKIMDGSNEAWMEAVEEYLDTTEDYFEDFQNNTEDIAEDYGLTMEDMCESSNEMAEASTDLANTINTEVLGAISNELYAVQTLMQYMAESWGPTMDGIITKYEQLLPAIKNVKNALSVLGPAIEEGAVFTQKEKLVGDVKTIINEFNNWLAGLSSGNAVDVPEFVNSDPDPKPKPTGLTIEETIGNYHRMSNGSVYHKNEIKSLGKNDDGKEIYELKSNATAQPGALSKNKEASAFTVNDVTYYQASDGMYYPANLFYDTSRKGPEGTLQFVVNNNSGVSGITDLARYKKGDKVKTAKGLQKWQDSSGDYYFDDFALGNYEFTVLDVKFLDAGYFIYKFKSGKDYFWLNAQQLQSLDTGGYTGEWGPEGKLAMLHQKELVLNAKQTEDLFMTMELLDSILKQIDLMSSINKINSLSSSVNNSINGLYKDTLQQDVYIEANFPNVTDRNEIQEAFNTLINEASQYVNRF